jgi:hypothetical protein
MDGDGSKLHGILIKYKIKFRSIDHELRQPLQSLYAGAPPLVVFAALRGQGWCVVLCRLNRITWEMRRASWGRPHAWRALVSTAAK